MIKKEIEHKIKNLPEEPGIYQYFNSLGKIIYVGKAKNIKKRVTSYFSKQHDDGKTTILVSKIYDIQYIVVKTEIDALLLENSLIKKHQPRYNILLKDDKTYPWICIKNEPFPRVVSTRNVFKDGSKYFGPYPNGKVLQTLLKLFRELYSLRTCHLDLKPSKIAAKKYKICLEYHIGKCKAPCINLIAEEEYLKEITQIEQILKGNLKFVIDFLKTKMKDFASTLLFEEAQLMKDKIIVLENYQAKSTVVSPTISDIDVVTIVHDEDAAFVNYFVIKNGTIINGLTLEVQKKLNETDSEILGFILPEFREKFKSTSKEIILENEIDFVLPDVQFFVPKIGDKKHLIELSKRNATYYKIEKLKSEKIKDPAKHTQRILETLKKDLSLKELPIHIECFDNSNIQGTNAVAACVVFKDAKPSKKDYRHFNIKTVVGPDDFASMQEVVSRRYARMLAENQTLPQLIVIDGGKGQLSSALAALESIGLRGKIAIIGIAKRLEEIFFPGDSIPIYLDKRSESLKVIQFMRNEAHRFGITHHRAKRSKTAFNSELTQIKGIGSKTFEVLMKKYKTLNKIKSADNSSLTEIIGKDKAKIILNYFANSESK
jgi:excinuclease ABC subunit C